MPLREDVTQTQYGGVKVNGDNPDVKLSPKTGGEPTGVGSKKTRKTAIDRGKEIVEKAPEKEVTEGLSNQWQNIYDYIQSSDKFSTPLEFDEFVSKYSNDENRMKNLFSHVSSDAQKRGVESPFQSSDFDSFLNQESKVLKTSGSSYVESLGQRKSDTAQDETAVKTRPEEELTSEDRNQVELDEAGNPIGSTNNIEEEVSPELEEGDSVDNAGATNAIATKVPTIEDRITRKANPLQDGDSHVDNDSGLFDFFFTPPDPTGIDKYDIMGDMRVDINTGFDMGAEDREREEKERIQRWKEIQLDEDTAKGYIDAFFNITRDMLSKGELTYEQLNTPFFDINNFDKLAPAIGDSDMNEKLLATFYNNPKLAEYYDNSLLNMKSTSDNILRTREKVATYEEIAADYNERYYSDPKNQEKFVDKFGSQLNTLNVMLLDNRHLNSFINTYAAMGYDVESVKESLDYQIKNMIYDGARENMMGWRSQVFAQIPEDFATQEERSKEFYLRYTSMMDREGLKYMNEDQKEAAVIMADINAKVRERDEKIKDGSWTLQDEKELQDMFAQRDELFDENALYDPDTGKLIDEGEANELQINWNEGVKNFESIYKDTDVDKLYKRREQLYFQLKWLEDNVVANHTYSKKTSNTTTKWTPDEILEVRYSDGKSDRYIMGDTGFAGNKMKALEVSQPYTYGMIKEIRQEVTALNNLILYNQDPASVSRGSGFYQFFDSAWHSFDQYMGGEDEEYSENTVRYQIDALQSSGFKLTQAQEDRLVETNYQTVGNAVGGSIPAMGEILLWTVVAKNVGGAVGAFANAEKWINRVSGGNKMLEGALTATNGFMKRNGIYQAVNTGFIYELSGQGFSTGVGESAGQGFANKLLNSKLKKNFFSQFAIRLFGGATGETVEEYSGEFLNHLDENGFDIEGAFSETVGDSPLEKLLITYAVSLVMSTPTSGFRTVDNIMMRKYIENNKDKFPDKNVVDEVLALGNEDGRIDERSGKLLGKEITLDSVNKYKTLKKREGRGERLSDDEKLEIARFENGVKLGKDYLDDAVVAEVDKSFPDLLTEELDVNSVVEGTAFEDTRELSDAEKTEIEEEYGVTIDTNEDGSYEVVGDTQTQKSSAEDRIRQLTTSPEIKKDPSVSTEEGAAFDLTQESEEVVEETTEKETKDKPADEVQEEVAEEKTEVDEQKGDEVDRVGEQGGKEQVSDRSVEEKPVTEEVGEDVQTETKKPVKRNLTKEENKKVQSIKSDEELQSLKDSLGMSKSRAKSAEQVKRAYNRKKDADTETFLKAVDRAKGDLDVDTETEVTQDKKADIQKYAEINSAIKKGEKLIKEGRVEEGVSILSSAKETSKTLIDKKDQKRVSDRVDNLIAVSKAETTTTKTKEQRLAEEADAAAVAAAESEAALENVRKEQVGQEVTAKTSNVRGKKSDISGEVIKADRTAEDGKYEVLIKRDDKRAVKATYDANTGEYTFTPQDKSTEISQMKNFKASEKKSKASERKEAAGNRVDQLSDEIQKLSEEAGMNSKRGKYTGKPKAAVRSLLNKIAFAEVEGATQGFIDKFNSELNGLIKDDATKEELKLKRKLQNMMKKAQETTAETTTEAKVETKVKEKAPKKKKTKKKTVKSSGNPDLDQSRQTLLDAKTRLDNKEPFAQLGNSTKVNGKFFALHIKDLYDQGKITKEEYLELVDNYKDLQHYNKAILQEKEQQISDDAGSVENTIDEMDDQYQTVNRGVGSNNSSNTASVQPRKLSKKDEKKIKKSGIFTKGEKSVTQKDLMQKLADILNVKLFSKSMEATKKPKWIGKFTRSMNAITLRNRKDLDTFIHEVGHKISYKYNLEEDFDTGVYDSELSKLPEGSKPPSTIKSESGKKKYTREEQWAEFVRIYSMNPQRTRQLFPNLSNLLESKLTKSELNAIDDFGMGYSYITSMPARELLGTMVKMQGAVMSETEISSWKAFIDGFGHLFKSAFAGNKKGDFSIGFWGSLNQAVFEKSAGLKKAVKFAHKKIKEAGGDVLKWDDPYKLIRLMSNYQRNRLKSLVVDGLVDKWGKRVITKSGDLMNYQWLYGKLDTSSTKALTEDIELVESLLIAEQIKWRKEQAAKELIEKAEARGVQLSMDEAMEQVPDVIGTGVESRSENQLMEEILAEIEQLKTTNPQKYKDIKDSADRYREFALQTVRYLKDTGRITEEQFKNIEENQDSYASLRAALEDIGEGRFTHFGKKSIKSIKDLKRRGKGSDVLRDNPYSNLMGVLMESYYEGDRNNAVRTYMKMLEQAGGEIRTSSSKVDGDKEIKYYEDGKLKTGWVSSDLAYALESATQSISPNVVFDMVGRITKDLPQTMITSTPAFVNKNVMRDFFNRIFVSRTKFNPVKDFSPQGIVDAMSAVKEDMEIKKLEILKRQKKISQDGENRLKELRRQKTDRASSRLSLFGGSMSGWYFKDRSNWYGLQREVTKSLVKEGRTVFWKPLRFFSPSRMWKKWNKFVSSSEEINRIAEFKAVFKERRKMYLNKFLNDGMSLEDAETMADYRANIDAAFESKDLMDFTVAGTMMADLNRIFMFLNPALQGLNRMIKTFRPNDPKSWKSITLRLVFYSVVPTVMEKMYAAYNDDEDELAQKPEYEKDMFWNFKIAPNTWFRAPKPFELGMLSSGMSRYYDYLNGDENAWDGFDTSIKNAFIPVDGTTLLDNPFVQLYTGRDEFLGKDIVPKWEQGRDLELRDPKYASELGKMVHDIGLMDAREFDHFTTKTFSRWGNAFLNAGDAILGDDVDDKPIFSHKDLGVLSESPLYNSRDYQAILDIAEDKGVHYTNDDLDKLNEIKDEYHGASSQERKDELALEFQEESRRVREKWDSIIERKGNLHSIGGSGTKEQEEVEAANEESKKNRKTKKTRKSKRGRGRI